MGIKPEDALKHLARQSGAQAETSAGSALEMTVAEGAMTQGAAAGTGGALSEADREREIQASISASYFGLRRGLAVLAFALPILLWLVVGYDNLRGSISVYYHYVYPLADPVVYGAGAARDIMVGILCAAGAALFFYKGYGWKENLALNIGGIAAVLVAIAPMDWPSQPERSFLSVTHLAAAIIFFLAIAFVCLFCSRDTLALLRDDARRARFKRLYAVLGTLMVVLPLAVVGYHGLFPREGENYVTFFVEVAAIYVFATFWVVKSKEIDAIQRQ